MTQNKMTIRQLLLSLLALLGLLSLAGSLWEGMSVRQTLRQAQWMADAHSIADTSLRASAALAQERGITAAILANPAKATTAMRNDMANLRHAVDTAYDELIAFGAALPRLNDGHLLPANLQSLSTQREALANVRNRVDRQLQGNEAVITIPEWISIASQFINTLANTRRATTVPPRDADQVLMPHPLLMEALFTVSEYAGRERAIIGTAIAQNSSLTASELGELQQYRNIVEVALNITTSFINQFPADTNFSDALTALNAQFLGRYQELRQQVYLASAQQQAYPVDATGWYTEATRGIDSVLSLSKAISGNIRRNVLLAKNNATQTSTLLMVAVMIALAAIFIAATVINRRIIMPLVRLQEAARTITAGNLSQRFDSFNHDEIGELGRAFEQMRGTLLDDISQREHIARELHKLVQTVEQSTDAILITNPARDIEYVNVAFEQSRGYSRSELIGKNTRIFKTENTDHTTYQALAAALALGEPFRGTFTNRRADGNYYHEELTVTPLRDENGAITHYVSIGKDITDRVKAEQELRKLNQAIEQSVSSIVITDIDGRIEYTNPQFTRTTGYSSAEIQGHKLSMLKSGQTPPALYQSLWQAIRSGQVWEGELLNKRKSGDLYWEMVSISPVRSDEGGITHFVGIQNDISERKHLEERVDSLANFDEVTQLPNRTLLAQLFDQAMTLALRDQTGIALLTLDINRFKLINDSLGHKFGDRLLRLIAEQLTRVARDGDIIARYGGHEFVLVLPNINISQQDIISRVAQRLLDLIATPFELDAHKLHLSGSIGISCYPQDGGNLDVLLRHANAAMHQTLREGGSSYQFYTPVLGIRAKDQLRMEAELRQAITRDELIVYYQPKVDFSTGQITGMEALVRWMHPVDGLIPPTQFIPLAEETGVIVELGEWVLRQACLQNKQWQQAGLPAITVAVNLSARQLQQKILLSTLQTILDETGMEARYLELELTESAVMENPEESIQLLHQIKELGIRLAMDDFGTGYSSLSYLRRFPFDTLKIDRAFVTNITSDPEEATIALTVIAMAHSLRLKVVAEGVETEAQAAYLHDNNCDELQGYLFSKPVPAGEMETLLKEHHTLTLPQRDNDRQVKTLLLVDDDPHILRALHRLFENEGYHLITAPNPGEAFEQLALHGAGVVISDQRMPEMTGMEFLTRVKELYPETIRIVLSGHGDLEGVSRAVNSGILHKYFSKPWDNDELRKEVGKAFVLHRTLRKKQPV